MTGLYFRTAN